MDNCYLDALAVITFFKMSHKKHLFITGERGSGKSYLLNSILNQIEETMDMSDFFNYLLSRRTDTPEVVIKSNLIDDGKEYVIGRASICFIPEKKASLVAVSILSKRCSRKSFCKT